MTKTTFSANRAVKTTLLFVLMAVTSQWCIDRFWLYHSQNRVMQPSDYTVTVVPASSAISTAQQLSADGRFSVQVTTRGTSYAMGQENQLLLVVFASTVGAIGGSWIAGRFAKPATD